VLAGLGELAVAGTAVQFDLDGVDLAGADLRKTA
jgi:hypothetical protein